MAEGWISLHRKILGNELWDEKPFDKAHAWVDMLLLANFRDSSFWVRHQEVKVNRGQMAWSEVSLADRWGWSRGKVRRFLHWLETAHQIAQHKSNLTSLITIVKYEEYQGRDTADKTANRTTDGTAGSTHKNKVNKVNKENNEPVEPFALSDHSMILNDKTVFIVPVSNVLEWQILFPGVDVPQQLRAMSAWCMAHTSQRKTRRGIEKFIVSWLTGKQDKSAGLPGINDRETKAEAIRERNRQAAREFCNDLP
jgi:hypothetical protein